MLVIEKTTYSIADSQGRCFTLSAQPSSVNTGPVIRELPGRGTLVGYLVDDDDCGNPLDTCGGGSGRIYDLRNLDEDMKTELCERLNCDRDGYLLEGCKPNPDVVYLDVYKHSGTVWSLHGEGRQCQWDTSRRAGIWLPDECIGHTSYTTAEQERAATLVLAQQAVDLYNEWLAGECFGYVVDVFGENGEFVERANDGWDIVGKTRAEEVLRLAVAYAATLVEV